MAKAQQQPDVKDWEGRLKVKEDDWDAARDSTDMPDGTQQATIVDVNVADKDWGLSLALTFQNDAGRIPKFYNLEDPERMDFTKTDLKALGFDSPLHEVLAWVESGDGPLGLVVEIHVKTKTKDDRTFRNVYINRVLGRATETGGEFTEGDDIPF